jgi:hypothetical protein
VSYNHILLWLSSKKERKLTICVLCAYFAVEQMERARSETYTSTMDFAEKKIREYKMTSPDNVFGNNVFENSSKLDAYVTVSTSELVSLQEKWMAAANESELQIEQKLPYMRALCIALMLLFSDCTHTDTH